MEAALQNMTAMINTGGGGKDDKKSSKASKTAMAIEPPKTKKVAGSDRGPELERKIKELETRMNTQDKKNKQFGEQIFEIDQRAREHLQDYKRESEVMKTRLEMNGQILDRLQRDIIADLDKAVEDTERKTS